MQLNRPHKQSGSTLIVSLIILIILMLLGVTAMNTSDTQTKLAGNLQFENEAMNNAEAAMNAAENWLRTGTNLNDAGFTTYNTNTPELYPIDNLITRAAPNNDPLNFTWNDTNSLSVAANQRYLIEKTSSNSRLVGSSQAVGGRTSSGCNQVNTYRITARGESRRGSLKFVQSYYSVLSC